MTTHTLRVPGATLRYDVGGSGPVLLLIPGGAADSALFGGVRPILEQHYTVVTYDPRAISDSPLDGEPPTDGLIREHAEDVHRLLAELGTEPAYVFANSGGAITLMDHLTRHPEQVRVAVLHEPPVNRYMDASVLDGPDLTKIYREEGVGPAIVAFMELIGVSAPPPPSDPSPEHRAHIDRMQSNFAYFFGHLMPAIGEFTPDLDALKAVPARIVVGVGGKSAGQPAHQSALGLAADLGQTAEQFPGDHGGFVTEPAEFAARLREVLEGA